MKKNRGLKPAVFQVYCVFKFAMVFQVCCVFKFAMAFKFGDYPKCQMSLLYSSIVLSDEKNPALLIFISVRFAQSSGCVE